MQHELPLRPKMRSIDQELIAAQSSLTQALKLGQSLSGKDDKLFVGPAGIVSDSAQWSRIMKGGQHHFPQDKLNLFMDITGNEAPLLWLLHSRGYDLASLRQRETQMERDLREANERIVQLEAERDAERANTVRLLRDLRAVA